MTTMPSTLPSPGLRSRRSLGWGAAIGVLTTVGVLAVVGVVLGGHHSRGSARLVGKPTATLQQAQLTRWEADVHPLILSAGQVVALGPRQGVQQLEGHEFSAATNKQMAEGWVARLTQLRAQLTALDAPIFMAGAQSLLDRSFAGYITASQDLLAAATTTGARHTGYLDNANAAGRAADRLYDQATAAIAAMRAHLGLAVDWSGSS